MTLPGIFHSQPSATARKVLFLAYSDSNVQAHLLSIVGTATELLEHSMQLQFTDDDTALIRTDECLQKLGPESESVDEVLLGLDPNWVHNGEIAHDKKALLKRIFTELSLKPLGFISFAEALSQDLSVREGTKSALLVYCAEQKIVLIHLNNGVIERAESIGRSDAIVADVSEGLARFARDATPAQHLPAKILLASFALQEEQLQELQQQLLEHTWSNTPFFLHAPLVSIVPHEETVQSIAREASAALALDTPQARFQESSTHFASDPDATHALEGVSAQAAPGIAAGGAAAAASAATAHAAAHTSARVATHASPSEEYAVDTPPTSFGIPMKHHAEAMGQGSAAAGHASRSTSAFGTLISEDESDPVRSAPDEPESLHPATARKHLHRSIAIGVVAGVLALVALAFGALVFFTSATATITLAEKPVSETVEITLDPSVTTSNPEQRMLAAKVITEELTGSGVLPTTGVKIVGEQASGEVILYNKTEADKTFEAGTVLRTDKMEYRLDDSVTVPAAVVEKLSSGEKKEYGQKAATVIANKIGDDGNTGDKVELRVASFATSTYSAESLKGFAGGSSREVRVVSEKDRSDLLKEVTRKVLDQANADFKARSGRGTYILSTTDISVTESKFDAELETEATSLSLNISARISALSYAADDLKPIAAAVLASKIPAGFTLSTLDPQIMSAPVQQATAIDKPVLLTANIASFAVPAANTELWQSAIAGKSITDAQEYLTNLEEVSSASIELQPSIVARFFPRLPQSPDRVMLQVAATNK
jgi:hypothetical protein